MSNEQLAEILIGLLTLIMSLSVHEWAHAAVAYLLGDDTAAREGRLTLNPISHIDPIGSLLLPGIMLATSGGLLGWAKPVPFNPVRFTRKLRMKTSTALVAAAGPGSNLVLAILAALVLSGTQAAGVDLRGAADGTWEAAVADMLFMLVFLNVLLMILNLIPLPPLDGHKILIGFLSDRHGQQLDEFLVRNSDMTLVALLAVIFVGGDIIFAPVGPITRGILAMTGVI